MTDGKISEKGSFLSEAESLLKQGRYQAAQDIALEWLARFPGDADAQTVVCHAWTRMGKLDKVNQMLAEIDEAILGMSRIYARMGDICRQSGLNREAVTFYKKFIALNPDSSLAESVSKKLDSLFSPREQTTLPEDEEIELVEAPLAPSLKTVTMAELYLRQGHTDMAQEVLKEVLKKDPANQKAAAMFEDIQGETGIKAEKRGSRRTTEEVISELSRWLNNINRLRSYAT